MKTLLSFILIILLSAFAEYFGPWWMIAVVAFLVTLIVRTRRSFFVGFLAIFIFWFSVALMRDIPNGHILSTRMADVLPLHGNYILFLIVTGIIGGLIGGVAAWSGSMFRRLFSNK